MHDRMGHAACPGPARGATGIRQTAAMRMGCTMAGGSETGPAAQPQGDKVYYSSRYQISRTLLNWLERDVSHRESHVPFIQRARPPPPARVLRATGARGVHRPPGSHAHVSVVLEVLLMQRARQPPSTKAQRASGPWGLALLRAPAYCPLLNQGRTGRAASLLAPRRRPRRCARRSSPGPCTPAWHMHGMCMVYAWHVHGICMAYVRYMHMRMQMHMHMHMHM